ncbi:hypothetical protein HY227_01140 [Candidatus Wolfebacteria bacterium]|nr:hypothetical protein [Candidatus Wolfebacteria bacterium]
MPSFKKNQSISKFQKFVGDVYGLPDDRLYSVWDLLIQVQRFTMRACKGIRKDDLEKLKSNLIISLSWFMGIANRFHINIEDELWRRFPAICSYCGGRPCKCKKIKPSKRKKIKIKNSLKPKTLAGFQRMFEEIYPPREKTITEAGVHLAEETGEISEAIHNYLGQHKEKQFKEIGVEMADFLSCVFSVASCAGIDIASELHKTYRLNCHICHKAPCICSFGSIIRIKT